MNVAFAQKAQLTVVSPDINADSLKDSFDVHYGSSHKSSLPDRQERERVLTGLEAASNWDELKRDIFYMDIKTRPLEVLAKKYPEIPSSELTELKGKIK